MAPLGGPRQNITTDVWYRKTRMMWLPDGEKCLRKAGPMFLCLSVISTKYMNVAHRRTPHDGIGRAYA